MEKKKRRIKVPHTYVILLICVFVVAVATWFVPTGQYDRVVIDDREVVDVDSYHETEPTPIGLFAFFRAIPEGMENSAQIIFFILIVAGMFNVVMATGSIQKGIGRLALVSEGKGKNSHTACYVCVFPGRIYIWNGRRTGGLCAHRYNAGQGSRL